MRTQSAKDTDDRPQTCQMQVMPGITSRRRRCQPSQESASGQGSGLGLAIAQSYAKAHGLELVYVEGEDGARFELVLPSHAVSVV